MTSMEKKENRVEYFKTLEYVMGVRVKVPSHGQG